MGQEAESERYIRTSDPSRSFPQVGRYLWTLGPPITTNRVSFPKNPFGKQRPQQAGKHSSQKASSAAKKTIVRSDEGIVIINEPTKLAQSFHLDCIRPGIVDIPKRPALTLMKKSAICLCFTSEKIRHIQLVGPTHLHATAQSHTPWTQSRSSVDPMCPPTAECENHRSRKRLMANPEQTAEVIVRTARVPWSLFDEKWICSCE